MRNPQRTILIGHNCFEKVDKDTIKQLCVSCGGKGFYLLVQVGNTVGEITPCDCEDGFKYSKMIEEYNGPKK